METLAIPEEAAKIQRLQKELGASRRLIEVADESVLFENTTNKMFNKEMNRLQRVEVFNQAEEEDEVVRENMSAADKVIDSFNRTTKSFYAANNPPDRDFSRKPNSFANILVSEKYANFRFSKRANEVLSPLSPKRFGFSTRQSFALTGRAAHPGKSTSVFTPNKTPTASAMSGRNGHGSLANRVVRHRSLAVDALENVSASNAAQMQKTMQLRQQAPLKVSTVLEARASATDRSLLNQTATLSFGRQTLNNTFERT